MSSQGYQKVYEISIGPSDVALFQQNARSHLLEIYKLIDSGIINAIRLKLITGGDVKKSALHVSALSFFARNRRTADIVFDDKDDLKTLIRKSLSTVYKIPREVTVIAKVDEVSEGSEIATPAITFAIRNPNDKSQFITWIDEFIQILNIELDNIPPS